MPRDFDLSLYRNIGIMAHIDAGKTILYGTCSACKESGVKL